MARAIFKTISSGREEDSNCRRPAVVRGLERQVRAPFFLRDLLERDLRDIPLRAGAADEFVVVHGVEFVDDAAGLAHAHTGLDPAEQFAVMIEAVDFPGAVAAVDVLGGDLNGPGRAYSRANQPQ